MSWLYSIVFAGLLISNGAFNEKPIFTAEPAATAFQIINDVTERFEQTYPLDPNGRVSLSNINGSVTVEGWDRNEVKLLAIKTADSSETMSQFEVVVNSRPDHLEIETQYKGSKFGDYDKGRSRRSEVQYRLQVPKGAVLNEIEAVNGSVTVSNFVNFVKVSAVNGTVNAVNIRGRINLSTVNGEVRTSIDGAANDSSYALDSVNGRVNLELPSDINATIKADSLNGSISNEFGLPVKKGKYVGRNLHARLGSGNVQIKLSTVNGGLSITRKKDGRTPGSVTDLLKQSSSEEDDSDSTSERIDIKDINETITNAAAAAEKGVKEYEKSLEKMAAEHDKITKSEIKRTDAKVKVRDTDIQRAVVAGIRQADSIVRMSNALWGVPGKSLAHVTKSFDVKGVPSVSIDASQCSVVVRGWDNPKVKYVLSETRSALVGQSSVLESVDDKSISLTIERKDGSRRQDRWIGGSGTRLEVFIPRRSNLRVSSEKEIRLQAISGHIEIAGNDGTVSIRDSEGELKLSSSDGLVRVVGFKGSLVLDTADSDVYLEGDFDKIESSAGDGNITLTLPPTKGASISTNSAIRSDGLNIIRENDRTWRLGNGGPKYAFEFADGRLMLRSLTVIDTN
ncbi:MAG: hypothetical protein ACRD6X_01735 [Pyrinomonadaceae bacterium]